MATKTDNWIWASRALLAVLAFVMMLTVGDYGSSWDEDIRRKGGEEKLEYYRALFSGDLESAGEIGRKSDHYPGFHDLNLALLRRVSPFGDILTGHAFAALFGFLAVLGTMRLGRQLGGPAAGFWAGVLLVFTPTYYGHQFINPKDIPFACGYIWSLTFMVAWLREMPKTRWKIVAGAGLAIGATMATRVGGLLLLCYLGLFVALALLVSLAKAAGAERKTLVIDWLRRQAPRVAVAAAIAFLVLVAYWPSAHWKPFTQADKTLEAVTNYGWNLPVFFEGAYTNAKDLPFYYILKMFLITTPVIILALFGASVWGSLRRIADRLRSGQSAESLSFGLVLFAVVFPLAYVILKDSTLYNGVRHMLFILLPAMALCGWVVVEIKNWFAKNAERWVTPFLAVIVLSMAVTGFTMVRLHPYQYIYYNEIAGGVRFYY